MPKTVKPADIDKLLDETDHPSAANSPKDGQSATRSETPDDVAGVQAVQLRRQLVPFEVAACLATAGFAAHHGLEQEAAGCWFALGTLCWIVASWRAEEPSERSWRRRWTTIVTACGTAWLGVAGQLGLSEVTVAGLAVGTVVLAIPFWTRHNDEPQLVATAAPEPVVEPELEPLTAPDVDPIVEKWKHTVAADGSPLAGSYLADREDLPGGVRRYTIYLVPGKQATADATHAVVSVASAFRASTANLSIRPPDDGSQDRAVLVIAPPKANPLAKIQVHAGWGRSFDPKTGTIEAGRYADGAVGRWALHRPGDGAVSGFVCGETRIGKSTFVKMVGLEAAHLGWASVWPGCPRGGASFPQLLDGAPFPARSQARMLAQARAVLRLMDVRAAMMGLRGEEVHTPTPTSPMVLLIWDEVHRLFQLPWTGPSGQSGQLEILTAAAQIVQEGAKFSIGLIAVDQQAGAEVFAGNDALASNLMRQIMAFRTASSRTSTSLPGVGIDLRTLPEKWSDGTLAKGLGILTSGQVGGQLRTVLPDFTSVSMADLPHPEFEPWEVAAMDGDDGLWTKRFVAAEAEKVGDVAKSLAGLSDAVLDAMAASDPEVARAVEVARARRGRATPPAAVADPATARWWDLGVPPQGLLVPAPTLVRQSA